MKKNYIIIVAVLLASIQVFALGSHRMNNTVSVSGTGIVTLKPDTASITFSVETSNKQASRASQENAQIMTRVNEALLSAGIKKDDITTNNFNVYQESFYNSNTRQNEYRDYRVSNNVTIIIRDIDDVGAIIDVVLATGVNRLTDVSFYAKDTEKAYDEARKLAVQEAISTATILAEAAGTSIGKVIHISENSGNGGAMYGNYARKDMLMAESADYSTPIAPGSTEVSVTVDVVIELK